MNITAKFPAGVTEITVHGLHQWDYGRVLSIESASLSGMGLIEVHFASMGMKEAIKRACSVSGQTTTAVIPDICLEQDGPISAWVYCGSTTEGYTVLKVTMPVNARPRPSNYFTEPPADYSDQYTELMTLSRQATAAAEAATFAMREMDDDVDGAVAVAREAYNIAVEANDMVSAMQETFNSILDGTAGAVGTANVANKLRAYKADLSISAEDTKKVLLDLSGQAPLSLGLLALTFQVQWGSVMYQTCATIPLAQGGQTDYTIVAREDDRFTFTVSEQNGKIYIQRSVGFNKASPGTVIVYYARYIRLEPSTP